MSHIKRIPLRFIMKNVALLLYLLLPGALCSEHALGQALSNTDLDQLEKIDFDVLFEIGATDEYFSVRLEGLVVKEDGTILISDSGKTTIDQFDSEGNHIETIASEGNGPGELSYVFSLIDTHHDTLLVWQEYERRVDYFTREDGGLYRFHHSVVQEPFINQRFDLFAAGFESQFYVLTGLSDAELIAQGMPEYSLNPVAETHPHSLAILSDSLHLLKTPNYILEDPAQYYSPAIIGGKAILGMPPYRYQDRFLIMDNNHYAIARPNSSALYFYNSSHEIYNQVDLNIRERLVAKDNLDFAFQNKRLGSDVRIRRRLESYVADVKPPFLDVWLSEEHILLHTDNSETGKEMVILDREGAPIGLFFLSEFDEVRHFIDKRIYTIHRDPLDPAIRVYRMND